MARERGGDENQIDRPDSTSTLSHPTQGDPNGPQSAQASDRAALTAVTGHPDQEIQTGQHQPVTGENARQIVDHEADSQLGDRDREDDNSTEESSAGNTQE